METLNTHDKLELELSKKLARASLKGICTGLKGRIDDRHNEIIEVYSGKEQKNSHRHRREANIRLCKISC